MASGFSKMFGSPIGMGTSFSFTSQSPPTGGGFNAPQPSGPALGGGMSSPNSSGYGVTLMPVPASGGSPVFQSPSSNKFPAGGGAVVFTPHGNTSPIGSAPSSSPLSPYSYVGGSASSFVQMPSAAMMPTGMVPTSPYSSTMASNPGHHFANFAASPISHGYGPGAHYVNVQPYGYGARIMSAGGGHAYHQSPYQHQYVTSPYLSHQHSPRDEIVEPMHCSPIGQGQPQPVGSLPYQQVHRSPVNNPQRPQHLPAFLTGVDLVASVPSRPRRVFERSPSTSPPAPGSSSRNFQSKSPSSWTQQDAAQPSSTGYSSHGQMEANNAMSGGFTKRTQGQGPSRQLRFNESQIAQHAEEKEKTKRSGPPIRGFGFGVSEEVSNFLSSPLLKENASIVPGAAIAQEAVAKAGSNVPIAESNWITVFGFPAAAASFIYNNFAQYGSIVQSKCNPGGNWMHIQYASRIDARRALACNGKVLGGTIMVGVISSPREVIEKYEKPQQSSQSSEAGPSANQNPTSPTVKSPLQERNLSSSTAPEGTKFRTIRPLAGSSQLTSPVMGAADRSSMGMSSFSKDSPSFISSPGENQNNENLPLPSASTGMLTKAMEYMFGW